VWFSSTYTLPRREAFFHAFPHSFTNYSFFLPTNILHSPAALAPASDFYCVPFSRRFDETAFHDISLLQPDIRHIAIHDADASPVTHDKGGGISPAQDLFRAAQ